MKPEHWVLAYMLVSIGFGLVLWWRRNPWSKNPVFPMLMMPLVLMAFFSEWLDELRDKYSPQKEQENDKADVQDSGGF